MTGVGPTAVELHYIEKTISGQLIERKSSFSGPVGVCGGGSPHMLTFDGSVGGASLQFNNSGNQVTYTLTGGLRQGPRRFTVPVPATVTSSGSAQPRFALAQWNIGSSQDSLAGSGSSALTITALNASGDQYFVCTTSNADATVTVSIQAQGAYAYLRGPDGQEGSSITISFLSGGGFSAVKTCSVVLDESRGSIPGGRDVATISVSGGSATSNKQIVLKTAFDHFEITLEKDEIAFTETSKIFVKAKDPDDNDVEINDDTELLFSLGGESAYGTFIKPNGDTVKTADPVVDRVKYSDAKAGRVIFAAVAANPATSARPLVRVSLQNDSGKKGEKEIVVLEQTLRIVMAEPQEVEPRTPLRGVLQLVPANRKVFAVRLTRGGVLVGNHPFTLRTDYVDGSGGHDHTNGRTDNNENYGYFISQQGSGQQGRPLSENTLLNVMNAFEYIASVFGDSMRIKVLSHRHPMLLRDSVTVVERVPDLVELGPGQHYELVGAPQNHAGTNDPCRAIPPASQHSRNHFGAGVLITAIQNIAASYDSLHPSIRLRINDMSLEYGGLFDKDNNWQVPHREHRVGRNADIGFTGIDFQNRCTNLQRRDLARLIRNGTQNEPLTEGDHYHIRAQ